MAAEDIEKKVRSMAKESPEKGQELQKFQEAQNQLVQVNAERQSNLQVARVEDQAMAAQNETLAQAAEMAAMGAGTGGVQQQVQSMNPQTQAVLGKYGLGQPKVQRTSSRSVQVTPQKITINNNTTNTTTNNVAVPAANIGGPVQGRTLAVKQNPDESQARFKTWITNAFAKQNQQAAVREKEYQRREWSLTRSTNKLMKHLADMGKSVSSALNPQKMASSVGGQLKTMLFLFGTMYLAKNWKKVISIGASIERFFLGDREGDGERGRSGFAKMLISAFGGNPDDEKATILGSLGKLFYNKDYKGGGEQGAGILNLLFLKFKHFFQEGAEAVKNLELPKLISGDTLGSLKNIMEYLGRVITTLFTGSEGLKNSMTSDMKKVGNDSQFGVGSDGKRTSWANKEGLMESRKFDTTLNADTLKEINGVGYGKGGVNYGDFASERNNINTLRAIDMDSSGNLTGTVGSTIRQSAAISGMLRDKKSVNTVGILRGLRNLEKTVKDNKAKFGENAWGVAVKDRSFFTDLGLTSQEITELVRSGDIKLKKYKYVIDTKTPEELKEEARAKGGSIEYKVVNAAASGMVDQFFGTNKMIGTIIGMAGGAVLCLLPGGQIAGIPLLASAAVGAATGGTIGNLLGQALDSPTAQATLAFAKAQLIPNDVPLHMIRMVPASDPRPGLYYNSNDGTLSDYKKTKGRHTAEENIIEKYTVTEGSLNKIKEKLGLRSIGENGEITKDLPLDETNIESLSTVQDYARGFQIAMHGKSVDKYDYDISRIGEAVSNVEKLHKDNQEEFDRAWNGSAPKQAMENWGSAIGSVKNYFSGKEKKYPPLASNQKEFVDKMRTVYKNVLEKKGIDTKYADVLTAQSALESSWGKSQSGKFNFSGIKADKDDIQKGLYTECRTTEYENGVKKEGVLAKFRDFNSLEDFAEYKVNFVNRDRYKAFDGDSINDYINRVVNGGYATAPNYGEILADFVRNIQSNYPDETIKNNDSSIEPTQGETQYAENTTQPEQPENYVEQKPTEYTTGIDSYEWGGKSINPDVVGPFDFRFGGNRSAEAMLMAQNNATPVVAPEKVTQTTASRSSSISTIGGNVSSTAGREMAKTKVTNGTEEILNKMTTLNDNIKLLQQGQLAQIESTNNVASGLGNMTINVNQGEGNKKTAASSWSPNPFNG